MKTMTMPQLRALLVFDILSVGLLCMPRILVTSEKNGILSAAAAIALAMLCAALTSSVRLRAKPLLVLYFLKTSLEAGLILKIFSELISATVLSGAGTAVINALMLGAVVYSACKSTDALGRTAKVILPFAAAVFAVCLLFSLKNADIANNLNIDAADLTGLLPSVVFAGTIFFPLEICMFLKADEDTGRAAMGAVLISGAVIFGSVLLWQARFNYYTLFPVLDLTYSGELPAAFVRHGEGMMICALTAAVFFMMNSVLLGTKLLTARYEGIGNVVIAALIFAFSLLPRSAESAADMLYLVMLFGDGAFLVIIPMILNFIQTYREGENKK